MAGGLHGVDHKIALGPAFEGNAYASDRLSHVPRTLAEAATLFEESTVARHAFGDEVVDHYVNMARYEVDALGRP